MSRGEGINHDPATCRACRQIDEAKPFTRSVILDTNKPEDLAHMAADADRRADAELRDRLDALDDAQTEAVLDTLLRDAPDLHRKALRELSLIDADAVNDALNETGA